MEKQCCWKAGELHKRKKCGRLFQAKIRCKMSEINKILFKPKFLYVNFNIKKNNFLFKFNTLISNFKFINPN